jgi:hypothetical protein
MLTSKITKAVFDTLPAVLQAEYTADATKPEDYLLQTDDLKELRNAKARASQEKQEAETKLAAMTTERDTANITLKAFKEANPDKAAVETEKQKAIDAALVTERAKTKAAEDKVRAISGKYEKTLLAHTVGSVINGLTEADDAHLLEGPVSKRIKIDMTGDEPKVVFLDESGQPTVDNAESFKKGIADDKRYAKIVLGSKATGGGAQPGNSNGGGANGDAKKFSEMDEKSRTALFNTNPAEFNRLSQAARDAQIAASYGRQALIR